MSRLKHLSSQLLLNVINRVTSLRKQKIALKFRWNLSKKIVVGLLASVFSMMALISFFGSSEQELSSQLEVENLVPELGASDELSIEFGLDASIPIQEPELQPTVISEHKSSGAKAVIKTVSTQPVLKTVQKDPGVKHAVEFGFSGNQGQVQHIQGEKSVHVFPLRPSGNPIPSAEEGAAVWLTGEIEEVNDLPVDGSFRRTRK